MTKQEFFDNLNELLEQVRPEVHKRANKMLNSGCIDLENYANDFSLPKAFLHAALKDIASGFKPLMDSLREDSENISHFI